MAHFVVQCQVFACSQRMVAAGQSVAQADGLPVRAAQIHVSFEGENAPAGPQVYDMVLVAVGRTPNGNLIDADKAGVAVTERGFINVDKQMRTNIPHIFAIGDISAVLTNSASSCKRLKLILNEIR